MTVDLTESPDDIDWLGNDDRTLSGVTDADLQNAPAWDRPLLEMYRRATDPNSDPNRALVSFAASGTPEFVKDRLRDVIISGEAIFSDIQGVSDDRLMTFRTNLADGLTQDGWTLGDITGRLQDIQPNLTRSEAETIARTETASAVNTAREKGYEETGMSDERFYWVGGQDDRTTEACNWLIRQTNPNEGGDPVTLERLKELIEEAPTHDPDMQDDLARPENFTVHPNERKTFVRHVED